MSAQTDDILASLTRHPPFDLLPQDSRVPLAAAARREVYEAGQALFEQGRPLPGLFLIEAGTVDIEAVGSELVSHRGPGDVMGERGLLRDGRAMLTGRAADQVTVLVIPPDRFLGLVDSHAAFAEWFARGAPARPSGPEEDQTAGGLTALQVRDLMSDTPITCAPATSVGDVAVLMRDHGVSSVIVTEGQALMGIVTGRDLTGKVLAERRSADTPVGAVMTPDPVTITPTALGLDALLTLADNRISHLPVADRGQVIGLVGKTDLFRKQATTASHMVSEIVQASTADEMAQVMTRVPKLLAQLVFSGTRPDAVCRRITDLTDAITRRLLSLAEARLGPPPVPYLWLACGSQGRREQTGLSDQDNCLILDDAATDEDDAYFAALAQFVSDGLNRCGFVYCPGDMMATNPRWRQPRRVWRDYFAGWIAQPDPMAQMLASVMFDLRPIGGDESLFADLQRETLQAARANTIFVAHMVRNSLKHTPPLSLFRGFALIRSGEHKNMLDLKHSGVVPVVDLGRVYAIQGAFEAVNTGERLQAAQEAGILSQSGGADLIDAYEMIAETRLRHQAEQIRTGTAPDNFMAPGQLSEFERNHLRDAFMVIKTMQSYLGHGRSTME